MSRNSTKNETKTMGHGKLAVIVAGATIALGGTATALAAQVPVLDRAGQLEQSLDTDLTRQEYNRLYDQAKRLDVAPKHNVAAGVAHAPKIGLEYATLSAEVAKVKAKETVEKTEPAASDFGTPESLGVSQSTLDAIAACESGGSPTIVDASGTYYGKYQFDTGTWASVGGSGLPSEAPEAEQDYRAAMLYSQAGSSPWPVCG
jgi:hypothetical protein